MAVNVVLMSNDKDELKFFTGLFVKVCQTKRNAIIVRCFIHHLMDHLRTCNGVREFMNSCLPRFFIHLLTIEQQVSFK